MSQTTSKKSQSSPYIIDWHQDISSTELFYGKRFSERNVPKGILSRPDSSFAYVNQSDLARLQEGNFKIVMGNAFPLIVDGTAYRQPKDFWEEYDKHRAVYASYFHKHSDALQIIRDQDELESCFVSHKIGFLLSVEGIYGWQNDDFETIDKLIESGVRSVGIMWNQDSNIGHGTSVVNDRTPKDSGLTLSGRSLISYLASHGIIVDITHSSKQTSLDILSVLAELDAQQVIHPPAIASHCASRAITDHVRNLDDDVVLAIAHQGGVIGIPFFSDFVGGSEIHHAINHLDHFKTLGILDHIVIGTDFDGMYPDHVVTGLEDAAVAGINLANALQSAGYNEEEVSGIFWQNALRFLRQHLPKHV